MFIAQYAVFLSLKTKTDFQEGLIHYLLVNFSYRNLLGWRETGKSGSKLGRKS
jgi:hypothetical protein